jgi:hypothetical protein
MSFIKTSEGVICLWQISVYSKQEGYKKIIAQFIHGFITLSNADSVAANRVWYDACECELGGICDQVVLY